MYVYDNKMTGTSNVRPAPRILSLAAGVVQEFPPEEVVLSAAQALIWCAWNENEMKTVNGVWLKWSAVNLPF